MKRLHLKEKEERRLLRGHLWVYRNELAETPALDDGQVVDVYTPRNRFVGRGFYQGQGGIAVRILTRHQEEIDTPFLAGRLDAARTFRERLYPGAEVYRWVFGESDGLPGFVADRYGSLVVAESACGFYRDAREALSGAFLGQAGITGFRCTIAGETTDHGEVPSVVECSVNGLRAAFEPAMGQKTGLFLDQRENWKRIEPLAAGATVLDGHCYAGLWSCHAARGGAVSVLGVDTSESALAMATRHAQLNGFGARCRFERADVMEVLGRGEAYDVVVLDPPSFAKSRAQQAHALGLHHKQNRAAMEAVKPGGYLITATCSHFVPAGDFLETLKRAANAAQRQAWLLDVGGAAPDHPVLLGMPETAYLTCATLRVF